MGTKILRLLSPVFFILFSVCLFYLAIDFAVVNHDILGSILIGAFGSTVAMVAYGFSVNQDNFKYTSYYISKYEWWSRNDGKYVEKYIVGVRCEYDDVYFGFKSVHRIADSIPESELIDGTGYTTEEEAMKYILDIVRYKLRSAIKVEAPYRNVERLKEYSIEEITAIIKAEGE